MTLYNAKGPDRLNLQFTIPITKEDGQRLASIAAKEGVPKTVMGRRILLAGIEAAEAKA